MKSSGLPAVVNHSIFEKATQFDRMNHPYGYYHVAGSQYRVTPYGTPVAPVPTYTFQPMPMYRQQYPVYDQQVPQMPPTEQKHPEDLRGSIRAFVDCLEHSPEHTQAITVLSERFAIKRRRLYDVINVFESVGACKKSGLDAVKWLGLENMKQTLKVLRRERRIDDKSVTLEELFPAPCCIGISNLTASFLLLFAAIKTNRVDLRFVSQFFSHGTARYKTTLCKLYQICYILSAIGVTKRTAHVCEVILNDEYCDPDALKYGVDKDTEPKAPESAISIKALLNKADASSSDGDTQWLDLRRKALESCYIENVTGLQDFEPLG